MNRLNGGRATRIGQKTGRKKREKEMSRRGEVIKTSTNSQ